MYRYEGPGYSSSEAHGKLSTVVVHQGRIREEAGGTPAEDDMRTDTGKDRDSAMVQNEDVSLELEEEMRGALEA
jgi:hypothetical protein